MNMYHLVSISKQKELNIKIVFTHKYQLPTILLNRLCIDKINFNVNVVPKDNYTEYFVDFYVNREHPLFDMSVCQITEYFKERKICLDVDITTEINL